MKFIVFVYDNLFCWALLSISDEPTASVDQKNSEEIIELILSLKKENKIIIIATHSPDIYNQVDHILEIKGEQKWNLIIQIYCYS